jgi:hypothetical protein
MPKVLFVGERYCDGHPDHGISNTEHNLFGSLEASKLSEYETLFIDEHWWTYGRRADAHLINTCAISRPDMVFISPLIGSNLNLTKETLLGLRKMRIPTAMIWWDTSYINRIEDADEWAPFVDLSIVVDRNDYKTKFPEKYLHLWCPQDTRLFKKTDTERDLDVVFIGSCETYNHSRRKAALGRLSSEGVNVFVGTGSRAQRLEIERYVNYLQRAKIVLNFPWTLDSIPSVTPFQMKARVYEACFCGALLMEGSNPYTSAWLEPGVDYVTYETDLEKTAQYCFDHPGCEMNTEIDLVNKVKYYLDHPEERIEIANRGCEKVTKNYNAEVFWKTVFKRVGI